MNLANWHSSRNNIRQINVVKMSVIQKIIRRINMVSNQEILGWMNHYFVFVQTFISILTIDQPHLAIIFVNNFVRPTHWLEFIRADGRATCQTSFKGWTSICQAWKKKWLYIYKYFWWRPLILVEVIKALLNHQLNDLGLKAPIQSIRSLKLSKLIYTHGFV